MSPAALLSGMATRHKACRAALWVLLAAADSYTLRAIAQEGHAQLPASVLGKWTPISNLCLPYGTLRIKADRIAFSKAKGQSFKFKVIRTEGQESWLENTSFAGPGSPSRYWTLKIEGKYLGRPKLEVSEGNTRNARGELVDGGTCWYTPQ